MFSTKSIFTWIITASSVLTYGQPTDSTSIKKIRRQPEYPLMDLFDLGDRITGVKRFKQDSASTRVITFLPSINYTPHTKLAFGGLGNISFNVGSSRKTHLSVFNLFGVYTLNKQIIVMSKSVIWSNDNLFNFVGDWRYYKYPTFTYGLGSNTRIENKQLIGYSYFRFYQLVYRTIFSGFYIGAGYNLDYHYNVVEQAGTLPGDYQLYDTQRNTISSGLVISALHDTRRNQINPVAGANYANINYRKNLKVLGSNDNWQQVVIDLRKYVAFPVSTNNILAFWSYNWFTFNGKVPYFDLPSSAWDTYDNQGRGYIQGRFRSNNLVSFETEYRFGLTRNRLLGGVVFSNVQTVNTWETNRFEVFYPAAGLGIRLKLSKQSNTNASVDYSFGLNGERGLFFSLGEVF